MGTVFLEAPSDWSISRSMAKRSACPRATLLDACQQQGIDTPTLRYLENLTPVNVCQVCGGYRSADARVGLLTQSRTRHDRARRLRTGAHQHTLKSLTCTGA